MRTILAAIISLAGAGQALGGFDTGNSVLEDCHNLSNATQAVCLMQSSAYLDMMIAFGMKCDLHDVTRNQVKDVLIKSLETHPADRNKPAAVLAFLAFGEAFGCQMPPRPIQ